jgi:hypothetical protein
MSVIGNGLNLEGLDVVLDDYLKDYQSGLYSFPSNVKIAVVFYHFEVDDSFTKEMMDKLRIGPKLAQPLYWKTAVVVISNPLGTTL